MQLDTKIVLPIATTIIIPFYSNKQFAVDLYSNLNNENATLQSLYRQTLKAPKSPCEHEKDQIS